MWASLKSNPENTISTKLRCKGSNQSDKIWSYYPTKEKEVDSYYPSKEKEVNWLLIEARCKLKVITLTWKALINMGHTYIENLLKI